MTLIRIVTLFITAYTSLNRSAVRTRGREVSDSPSRFWMYTSLRLALPCRSREGILTTLVRTNNKPLWYHKFLIIRIGIVMGTLVLSTQYGVIIALYQSCISDANGQSVEKFYDFWCNWRSLKPFLSRVILTQEKLSEEKFGTGNENYELFFLFS